MDSQQGSPNSGNSHAAYPAANLGSTSQSSSPPPSPPARPDSSCGHMSWETSPFPFGALRESPSENPMPRMPPMPLPSYSSNPSHSPHSSYPLFTSARASPHNGSSSPQPLYPPGFIFPASWASSSQRGYAAQRSGRYSLTDPFGASEVEELAQRLEQAFNDQKSGDVINPALPIRTRTSRVAKPGPYAPRPRARGKQPSTTPEVDTSSAMPRGRPRDSRRAAHRDTSDGGRGRRGTSSWLLSHPLFTGEAFRRSYLHPFGGEPYRSPPRVTRSPNVDRAASSASKPKSIFGDGPPPPGPECMLKSVREPNEHAGRRHDYSARDDEDVEMGEAAGDEEDEDEDEEEEGSEDVSREGAFDDVVLISDSEEWEQVGREEEPWDLVERPVHPAQRRAP